VDIAAACSHHPVTAHAVGEVVGQVLERLGDRPPVALVAVSAGHGGALEDAVAAVRSLLDPGVAVGWAARQVATAFPRPRPARARSLPAVGLWAGGPPGARPVGGSSPPAPAGPGPVLLIGSAGVHQTGGTADGPRSDVAGAPVVLDGDVLTEGCAGVAWPAGSALRRVSFDGRRAVGPSLRITDAGATLLVALDGRPAMEVLTGIARDSVPARDIELINRTVHLELADTGELVAVRGRDRATGALAVDPPLVPGDVVRFCVLDPEEAADVAASAVGDGAALVWDAGGGVTPVAQEPSLTSGILSWSSAPGRGTGAPIQALVAGRSTGLATGTG
jgi:small ligand-binding sensory domain FIST